MLKKITLLLTLITSSLSVLIAQNSEVYFTDYPTLTPDASTIIFSHEGDLWKMPATGGLSSKITSMEGNETLAKVSPDGKWLAFTGTVYGNSDVFIMPLNGGNVQQLTYHQASDRVSSWVMG